MTLAALAPQRRRWRHHAVQFALLIILLLTGWLFERRAAPADVTPTAVVAAADIDQIVLAAGKVQPSVTVDVGAQVSGQVRRLYVGLGQHVPKGALLVSLDPALAESDVQQAKSSAAQQEAVLERLHIDLIQARQEYERELHLFEAQVIARKAVDKAQAEMMKLEADVRAQTATLTKLNADLSKSRLHLGFTRLLAPIEGDVVSLSVQEGFVINAAQLSPILLTLAKLDTVTIHAQVSEADVMNVHLGQAVSFTTWGEPEHRYESRVRAIQPQAEKVKSSTSSGVFYDVLFDVPNPHRALLSDMTVQVSMQVAHASQVLSIPIAALGDKTNDGSYLVQVVDAAGAHQARHIHVGINDSARVQVLDGLRAGERVVVAPQQDFGQAS